MGSSDPRILYTEERAAEVLSRMEEGASLRAICRDESTPHRSTVKAWIRGERGAPKDFATQYAHARAARAEFLAEEVIEIADAAPDDSNAGIQRAKLRADARKWAASRMDPKHWGDRVQHDVGGQVDNPLTQHLPDVSRLSPEKRKLSRELAYEAMLGSDDPSEEEGQDE